MRRARGIGVLVIGEKGNRKWLLGIGNDANLPSWLPVRAILVIAPPTNGTERWGKWELVNAHIMAPRKDRPVVCPADEWHQGNGEWGNGNGKRGMTNTQHHGTPYGRSHVVAPLTNGTE